MKRMVWLLLLAFLAVPAAAFAQTDQLLVSFEGFDYEYPDANPTQFGVGDWYNVVITCSQGAAPGPRFSTNSTRSILQSLVDRVHGFRNFRVINYTTGRVRVFEDPLSGGTRVTSRQRVPRQQHRGRAPRRHVSLDVQRWIAGSRRLGGGFVVTLDLAAGTGSFGGDVHFDEGSKLGSIPVDVTRAYTFAGLTSEPSSVYNGYDHQVSGEIRIEQQVRTQASSWGKMKALYR